MSDKKLLEAAVVTFFSGKKEYRSLSNFWEQDVVIEVCGQNRHYESGEHCFHGEKYIRLGELCEDEGRRNMLLDYGRTFMKPSLYVSGAAVKKMGGKKGLLLSHVELSEWDSLSVTVQREICKWKVDNYAEVREDLVKSGTRILIHPAMRCNEEILVKKKLWEGKAVVRDGKVVVLGKNRLGNIWMDFR